MQLTGWQLPACGGDGMDHVQEQMVIRQAVKDDAAQIAEILVEDWKTAYRGIIDSAYLDAMSVEERYQREVQRYQIYTVAACGQEVLGFAWNETIDGEGADCEIVALYVRYAKRKKRYREGAVSALDGHLQGGRPEKHDRLVPQGE